MGRRWLHTTSKSPIRHGLPKQRQRRCKQQYNPHMSCVHWVSGNAFHSQPKKRKLKGLYLYTSPPDKVQQEREPARRLQRLPSVVSVWNEHKVAIFITCRKEKGSYRKPMNFLPLILVSLLLVFLRCRAVSCAAAPSPALTLSLLKRKATTFSMESMALRKWVM